MSLSDYELGWLVGILEGEGSFALQNRTQNVTVEMCDEDTINRVAVLFERLTGTPIEIREVAPAKSHWSYSYKVVVYGENARTIMLYVVRHMMFRRRKRIWQSLNRYKPKKIKLNLVRPNLKVVA